MWFLDDEMKKEKIQNRNEDSSFIYTYTRLSQQREIRTLIYMSPWVWPIDGTHTPSPPGRDHSTSLKTYEAVELTGIKGRTRDRDGTVHAEGEKG